MKNIIIVIAIILALAGGWFVWANKEVPQKQSDNEQVILPKDSSDPIRATEDRGSERNLLDILRSGQNQMCTYSFTNEDGTNASGTVYISGENMRSDYEIFQNNETLRGSMIKLGNTAYVWGGGMPQGIKMNFDMEKFEEGQTTGESDDFGPIDPTMDIGYDCQGWTVDQTIFTPPADIQFTDLTLQGILENLPVDIDVNAE